MKSEKWLLLTMIGLAGLVYSIISEDKEEPELENENEVDDEETESAQTETGI
mgnify:CR=1 FL=1